MASYSGAGGGGAHSSAPLTGDGSVATPFTLDPAKVSTGLTLSVGALSVTNPVDTGTLITVAGSAVQTVDLTPMAGDTDGDYDFDFNIILPTGSTPKFTLAPNGLTVNLAGLYFVAGTGVTTDGTHIPIATAGTTVTSMHVFGRFSAKTGRPRFWTGTAYLTTAAGVVTAIMTGGTWNDTSTVLTKMTVNSDTAATIGVGSTFRWQKRNFLA